jgi:hypothetical protein
MTERSHLDGKWFKRRKRAARDGQIRAGPGERPRELLAEAAAGAGDEGGFAGEIEQICHRVVRVI